MIWMIAAALCAYFIKGLCGFANTLVFSTILSFGVDNINISPVELLLGYPTNLILCWKERKSVDWSVCLPLTALVLLGNIPGIFLLKNVDTQSVKLFFGVVIVCIGIEMFFRERNPKQQTGNKGVLALIGLLSGLLCGLYGIGALLAAYVSRVTRDTQAFKANICFVFIIENSFRIIVYSLTGILTFQALQSAVLLLPFMVIGLLVGMKSCNHLDEALVKRLVILLLVFSGIMLVINNL